MTIPSPTISVRANGSDIGFIIIRDAGVEAFSPDGKSIGIFLSRDDAARELWRPRSDPGGPRSAGGGTRRAAPRHLPRGRVMTDLFDHTQPAAPPFGIKVKLDREVDRQKPCCQNVAVVHPGKAQHAGEMRCERCNAHRGWASKALIEFVETARRRFGAPDGPIVWHQQQQEQAMDYDNTNRGALFRNHEKTEEKHPDYRGNINVDGTEFWVSGWLKTSAKGMKYMSLAIKPKETKEDKSSVPFNDNVPFAPEWR